MAVIVHDDMSIDLALRMLWREANREGIIETLKDNRYYNKPSVANHDQKKIYAKQKRRRAARKRRYRNRGWLIAS